MSCYFWRMKITILCFLILAPQFSYAMFAQLSKKEIRSLIGDFPGKGSIGEVRDDNILLNYQATRTKADCDLASSQSKFKAEKVFVKPLGPLEEDEFEDVEHKVLKLTAKVGLNVLRAKNMYERPRPFVRNPQIHPCIALESSSSYPSGHTATGRAIGLYLAEKYPDRAEEILKLADQVGENRMIGGVHHPSDVTAGRKIGDEIFRRDYLEKLLED